MPFFQLGAFPWELCIAGLLLLQLFFVSPFVTGAPTGPIKYKKLVLHLMLSLSFKSHQLGYFFSQVPKEQKNYSWKSAFLRMRSKVGTNVKQTKSWGNLSFQSVC